MTDSFRRRQLLAAAALAAWLPAGRAAEPTAWARIVKRAEKYAPGSVR